jgi:hypothetical protein
VYFPSALLLCCHHSPFQKRNQKRETAAYCESFNPMLPQQPPVAGAWIVFLGDSARSRILRFSFGCRREMSWPFFFPFHVKHFLQKSIFRRSKTAELQEVCPKYD